MSSLFAQILDVLIGCLFCDVADQTTVVDVVCRQFFIEKHCKQSYCWLGLLWQFVFVANLRYDFVYFTKRLTMFHG